MAGASTVTLSDVLSANVVVRGHAPAVSYNGLSHSFASLDLRARSLAAALVERGLRHQDRVAILAQNCMEYCEAYAACEHGGFILVTVNFRLAGPEVLHVLRDSGARVLVFESAYAKLFEYQRDQLPGIESYLAIGRAPSWAQDFAACAAPPIPPAARRDDIAFLIYTSGTTGKPKGCILGQREEVEKARITAADIRMSAADRILLTMPLFHIGAKAMMAAQYWAGGEVVLHHEFRPEAVLRAVQQDRITILHLAPTMIQMLLDQPDIEKYDLSSLRAIVYSASAMPLTILQRGIAVFGCIFYQIYGLTEGIGTILSPEHHAVNGNERALKRLKSIGVPSPGVVLRIMRDDETECAVGVPGEIFLQTPTATRGYWNNSSATIDTLRDGWLRTGDIGIRDDDGFVYLVDRKKDMIISGGENIYSREVEDALYRNAAVLEAAVIGVEDPRWGEAVCAVVVLKPGACASAEDLIDHVKTLIAAYKRPKTIVFVDALPKTASGKIDKQKIRREHACVGQLLNA